MSTIPTITKQDIRTFVGEQNFLKGQHYVRDGAIVDPVQQGMSLKAYCYGSLPEPYRVQVTFDGSGITTTLCSCSAGTPTDGNHGCEHTAALLFAWKEQPEAFVQMDDIDTILGQQSKAQLITLIKQLLAKQPEVEWQLTMPPLPGHKSVPIDTEEYRDQVDEAFHHAGHQWDAVYGISHDLYRITATAARFARQRDYANAAAIYEVVAMGTLSHYLSYHDEDGALGRVVQECVEGLGACLESEREDEILREQILEAIFAVYCFDVNHGGFGLTKDIPSQFLQNTTPEEKHLVAQWVHTALAELQEKKLESEWRLKHYGGLLLALEADLLSDEEFLRIGRETKSIQEVVTRLLELADGRTMTALDMQWEHLDLARKYAESVGLESVGGEEIGRDILRRWEHVLGALESDPMSLATTLDWVAKYRVINGYRERHSLSWRDPKLAAMDLQYHDLRPERSLFARLGMERLLSDESIDQARLGYERSVFGGDHSLLDAADRALDAAEADLALARGRILHARFLAARRAGSRASWRPSGPGGRSRSPTRDSS